MSPFMWLGLLALVFGLFVTYGSKRERRERRMATGVWLFSMATLWLFVSAASNPHGGWSIGPRYLGAAPPFFAFGAALALERIARRSTAWRVVARAAAAGLALASTAQVGFVSIVYNTVSETTVRPLAKFALPLAWAGFVPHHAGELFGWHSRAFWYVVAACFVGAVLLAALWPARDSAWSWTFRVVGVIAIATFGLVPAFSPIAADEPNDAKFPAYVASVWEPPGRDRITKAHEVAEVQGAAHPCLWYRLAELELGLGMAGEAARDAARAGIPRDSCR
jgi:vacuolar-type H+-ATPase subunit I/STV1